MNHYSLHIEVDEQNASDDRLEALQERLELADFHPSVGMSPRGFVSAQVSVVGESLLGATIAAVGILRDATGADPVAIESMTDAEFHARQGYVELPDLVSVPDAAEMLGLTRQRILQMIETRAFPSARKIGKGWVIALEDVAAKAPVGVHYDASLPIGTTNADIVEANSRRRKSPLAAFNQLDESE